MSGGQDYRTGTGGGSGFNFSGGGSQYVPVPHLPPAPRLFLSNTRRLSRSLVDQSTDAVTETSFLAPCTTPNSNTPSLTPPFSPPPLAC